MEKLAVDLDLVAGGGEGVGDGGLGGLVAGEDVLVGVEGGQVEYLGLEGADESAWSLTSRSRRRALVFSNDALAPHASAAEASSSSAATAVLAGRARIEVARRRHCRV